MKKRNSFKILVVFAILLSLIFFGNAALGGDKVENVEIHNSPDSGISNADANGYVDRANQIDAPAGITYVITSQHNYGPNTPYDPNKNDPCKINIWCMKKKPWKNPNVSGQRGNVIWLVPGDGNNTFIRDSTLAHELNHLNGIEDHNTTDPNNKMYPDNWDSNGVTKSGNRTGTNIDQNQIGKLRDSNTAYIQAVQKSGKGDEAYDVAGDVSLGFMDLDWAQVWMDWTGGQYKLHLTAQVDDVVSFFDVYEIGFYIDSDNDPSTGEPPEGFDYYVTYIPQFNEIAFHRYEPGLGWVYLPPEGITYELTYAHPDTNEPPFPVGIKLDIPLASFTTLSGNFAFKATATNYVERDLSPKLNLTYMPVPIPGDIDLNNKVDFEDLNWFCYDWLRTGSSRADIYPPPAGDGVVDFRDFVIFAKNWKAWLP